MPEQEEILAQENENVDVVVPETEEDASSSEVGASSEQEEYSASVKKRINKLTYQVREAERQNEETTNWAQRVHQENSELQRKLRSSDSAMFSEYDNRVKSDLEVAKEQYKKAHESGDVDEVLKANEQLSRLAVESESLRRVANQKKAADAAQQRAQQQQQQQPQQQQVPEQPVEPDPKAQEWAAKNEWFGEDKARTFASFGIHQDLVEEGFNGQSDEYYEELDKRLYKTFPQHFNTSDDRPVQTVASPTRQTRGKNARNKVVRLNQRQVDIARKLGVSLEDYAKHVKE